MSIYAGRAAPTMSSARSPVFPIKARSGILVAARDPTHARLEVSTTQASPQGLRQSRGSQSTYESLLPRLSSHHAKSARRVSPNREVALRKPRRGAHPSPVFRHKRARNRNRSIVLHEGMQAHQL